MSETQSPLLIILAGPTASGKTKVGITLASSFGASIINVDSRQIFKELPIGTAAPTKEELGLAPHFFVGNCSIIDSYDAQQFSIESRKTLTSLFEVNPIQFAVGGSGLYIKALLDGMDEMPGKNLNIRQKWEKILAHSGIKPLQVRLFELDEEYYNQVDLHNPQRLIRALEVCESSGKPFSLFRLSEKNKLAYNILKIGLNPGKEILHERISHRVDSMMKNGLLKEVESLVDFKELNALKTVGYSELFSFLEGKTSLEHAVELIKTHTRQYAKRQMTWFKKDPDYQWFNADQIDDMCLLIKRNIH